MRMKPCHSSNSLINTPFFQISTKNLSSLSTPVYLLISLDATLEEYLEQASKFKSLRRKKKDYQRQFDAKIRESQLTAISTTLDEQGVNKLDRADYEDALGTLMEIISSIDSRESRWYGEVRFAHADGEAVRRRHR